MPIDPSIPLQVHQAKFPTALDIMSLKDLATRSQINEQSLEQKTRENQQQNALLKLLQDPNSVDPSTGRLTPNAIAGITQISPEKGIAIEHQQRTLTLQDLQLNEKKIAIGRNWEEAALNSYDRTLQMTGSKDEALKAFQRDRAATIDEQERNGSLKAAGFSQAEIDRARQQQRDPEQTRAMVLAMGGKIEPMKASSPLGNLEADYRAGRISEADYKEQKAKLLAPTNTTLMMSGQLDLPPETAKFVAQQYLAGDNTAAQGFARNARARAQIAQAIADEAKAQGMTPKDAAAAVGAFQGYKAEQRTLGTRTANIETAATEARLLSDLALKASAEWERLGVKTFNDLQKAAQSRTASPELRRFVAANTSFINAYARAINPQGVGTVADKEHAREMLEVGFSKGDYRAVIDQLQSEIKAAQEAPAEVKRKSREAFSGKTPEAPKETTKPDIKSLLDKYK